MEDSLDYNRSVITGAEYVLEKVDVPTNTLLKSVIDEAWYRPAKTKPEPVIF